jgi:hypothetical protein
MCVLQGPWEEVTMSKWQEDVVRTQAAWSGEGRVNIALCWRVQSSGNRDMSLGLAKGSH